VYTFKFLKYFNVFGYNDSGMVPLSAQYQSHGRIDVESGGSLLMAVGGGRAIGANANGSNSSSSGHIGGANLKTDSGGILSSIGISSSSSALSANTPIFKGD